MKKYFIFLIIIISFLFVVKIQVNACVDYIPDSNPPNCGGNTSTACCTGTCPTGANGQSSCSGQDVNAGACVAGTCSGYHSGSHGEAGYNCSRWGNAGDCKMDGSCTWTPTCCSVGYCTKSCGGGTCSAFNGNWYSTSCNTQACAPADLPPAGAYNTGYYTACSIDGWACDPSKPTQPLQVDIYVKVPVSTDYPNGLKWVASPVVSAVHNQTDTGGINAIKSACGGDATYKTDWQYILSADNALQDGQEHEYLAYGININSAGTRVDAGNTLLGVWQTNKMTCVVPTSCYLPCSSTSLCAAKLTCASPSEPGDPAPLRPVCLNLSCKTSQNCVCPIPTATPTPATGGGGACPKKAQGDANCDGSINGADYSMWLNRQCTTGCAAANLVADFDGNGKVDDNDYTIWFNNSR